MSTQNFFTQNPFTQAFKTFSDIAGSYASGAVDKSAVNPFTGAEALAAAAHARQAAYKNYQTFTAVSKSVSDFLQAAGRCNVDFAHRQAEAASEFVQQLASVKNPSEAFAKQSQFARECAGAAVANAKELSDIAVRFSGETAETVGSRFSEALEEVSGYAGQNETCASKKKAGFAGNGACATNGATSFAA